MAKRPTKITPEIREKVVAEWRSGQFTVRQLGNRHKLGNGTIHNIVSGIDKDCKEITEQGMIYKSMLKDQPATLAIRLDEIVDEKVRNMKWFNDAAMFTAMRVKEMIATADTLQEVKLGSEALAINMRVAGVVPYYQNGANINVNNTNAQQTNVDKKVSFEVVTKSKA